MHFELTSVNAALFAIERGVVAVDEGGVHHFWRTQQLDLEPNTAGSQYLAPVCDYRGVFAPLLGCHRLLR